MYRNFRVQEHCLKQMLVAKKIEIKKAKAFKAHIKYRYMNVTYSRFFLEKKKR